MTAFLAIEATSAGLRDPDCVLVLGVTGAVGRAATRIARARGCTVVTASRRDKVTDINILTDPTFSTVKSHLDGEGPDAVIDTKKLQPFAEEELVTVSMSGAAEAYKETMKISGKKHVILLEDKNQAA